MRTNPVKAKYHDALSDMLHNGLDLISFANRDVAEFTKMGIEPPFLDELKSDIVELQNAPDDVEVLGEQTPFTEEKDALAEEIKDSIRTIMQRAENKWGTGSARYRQFGTSGLSELNDNDLEACAKRVLRVAERNLADLAGLTTNDLTTLQRLTINFHSARESQHDAKANRDIKTEDRQITANDIYDRQVIIANTGKRIWENKSEAKYNDYVIYDTPTPPPPTPPA